MGTCFSFADCTLDPERFELTRAGARVEVQPKVFGLLQYLVENRDRVVSRETLLDELWPDVSVSEHALTQCVSEARKAIGDAGGRDGAIRTVARRGYQWALPVEVARGELRLSPPAIAVLSFDNLGAGPEWDAFLRGLAEELTTRFAVDSLPGLRVSRGFDVVARTTTERAQAEGGSIAEIAARTNAQFVIEGSVRWADGRLRITAQAIDARTGMHVWADNFEREPGDPLELQDELSDAILSALGPELGRHETDRAMRLPDAELGPWELVLKGSSFLWKLERREMERARGYFERAAALDPTRGLGAGPDRVHLPPRVLAPVGRRSPKPRSTRSSRTRARPWP